MDSSQKDFDYFIDKFKELADNASGYGLSTVIVIENNDPIARAAGHITLMRGTLSTALGLLELARHDLRPR